MQVSTPFEFHENFNVKCLVISGVLGLAYWITPKHNLIVLMLILIVSYFAVAWYDTLYKCNEHITMPEEIHTYQEPQYTYLTMKKIYLFHLFLVAPMLLYCGTTGYGMIDEFNFSKCMFGVLTIAGVSAFIYHGYNAFYPKNLQKTMYAIETHQSDSESNENSLTEWYDDTDFDNYEGYTGAPQPSGNVLSRAHNIQIV